MLMRITSFAIALALFSACNPGHKMDKGRTLVGEAYKTADGKAADPLPEATAPGPELPIAVSADNPPPPEAPPVPQVPDAEPEMDEAGENNKTASEPVPIGGAYLTCRYLNGQMQGNDSYSMECEVAPLKEVGIPIVSAAFFKLDAQGNRSPLAIVTQDLLALKWTVQDTVATMGQSQVQVVLGVPGLLSVSLTTTVSSTFNLVQNTAYWLGGEPNSLNEDEDCVEFVSANGKTSHQNFSGFVSGPLGRMNDFVCAASRNFLCRNISAGANNPKWIVSTNAAPFENGALACSQGYAFGFPLNTTEINEVITLVDQLDIRIWVNMSDRATEKTFVIKFR